MWNKGGLKWAKQVEEEHMKVGFRRDNVLCGSKWIVGVFRFPQLKANPTTLACWDNTRFKTMISPSLAMVTLSSN